MSRTFILISPEAEKLGAKHLPIFFRHPVPLIPFKILVWHHLIHFIKGGVMWWPDGTNFKDGNQLRKWFQFKIWYQLYRLYQLQRWYQGLSWYQLQMLVPASNLGLTFKLWKYVLTSKVVPTSQLLPSSNWQTYLKGDDPNENDLQNENYLNRKMT